MKKIKQGYYESGAEDIYKTIVLRPQQGHGKVILHLNHSTKARTTIARAEMTLVSGESVRK